jgi:hypothetical protein
MSSLVHLPSLIAVPAAAALALYACDVKEDGAGKIAQMKVLQAKAESLKVDTPLTAVRAHVCGFHFESGAMERQLVSHRFIFNLGEEVMHCLIYDSDRPDARLVGIEYIIGREKFDSLPEEEKKFWHSHVHAVKSGQLIAPGLPEGVEKELMRELVDTYGKTWFTWQVDLGDELPLGTPRLMMGSTADEQIDAKLLATRDREFEVSSPRKRESREDLPSPRVLPGADSWQSGPSYQIGPLVQRKRAP